MSVLNVWLVNSGNNFIHIKESVEQLYFYRNSVAHFHAENLDMILYSLLKPNIIFYIEFAKAYCNADLYQENGFIILPIGFTKPFSPIDFLSNSSALLDVSQPVKEFIDGIIGSATRLNNAGIQDSILVEYKIHLINEKKISNADIIARISSVKTQENSLTIENRLHGEFSLSNNPNAREVRISEDEAFSKIYTIDYKTIKLKAKEMFIDFKANRKFNDVMRTLKQNTNLYRPKYLDSKNPKSGKKDWYSPQIYDELAKNYTRKA